MTPRRPLPLRCVVLASVLLGGCGASLVPPTPPLFTVPLVIEGDPIGPAIIDTGGAYEIMLRERFGLQLVDTIEVLAFGGRRSVQVTEGFAFSAGPIQGHADSAIIATGICDCNALGFRFFRKTGTVLSLDFASRTAAFVNESPSEGVKLAFEQPPSHLPTFDSAFVEVEVALDGAARVVLGLLDTGANATVLRRNLLAPSDALTNRVRITVARTDLGTVAVNATLFDTPGLPDIIIGTDVMGAWANRWYFRFAPEGGTVTVMPLETTSSNASTAAARLR